MKSFFLVAGIAAVASANPVSVLSKRTEPCSSLPAGSGPVPNPDTAENFVTYQPFHDAANNADTPDGYSQAFVDQLGSTQQDGFLQEYSLDSYNVDQCADYCTKSDQCCVAFNIYFERDPTVVPGDNCPNPSSTTTIKCVLWGKSVSLDTATNAGQYRNDFHSVNAGSNGYNVVSPPQCAQPTTTTSSTTTSITVPTSVTTTISTTTTTTTPTLPTTTTTTTTVSTTSKPTTTTTTKYTTTTTSPRTTMTTTTKCTTTTKPTTTTTTTKCTTTTTTTTLKTTTKCTTTGRTTPTSTPPNNGPSPPTSSWNPWDWLNWFDW